MFGATVLCIHIPYPFSQSQDPGSRRPCNIVSKSLGVRLGERHKQAARDASCLFVYLFSSTSSAVFYY